MDFEVGLITANETEFRGATISGCYFHFCQSLNKFLRLILAICYLPVVRLNFQELVRRNSSQHLIGRYPALRDLIRYMELRFHQRWNNIIGRRHLALCIWHFMRKMKDEQRLLEVPRQGDDLYPILTGGDRLSEGNSRNIQWEFSHGDSREDRLEGLILKYEDWHAIRNKFGIHETVFFKEKSGREHGTMCSNMNVIKANNAKKGPHKDFNSFREFVDKDSDGMILTCTMEHFGMETIVFAP
ncbi:Hypp9547 [Branchiostoma lanceolatum]|uniref:Hypp9547 protein n=1 Tax=Branchiostoma lanceolatum TaxID=7740 RepID=A0A8S4MN93_BRALA|nr:Hypp9547 [Branchiostoma lanceolatum]